MWGWRLVLYTIPCMSHASVLIILPNNMVSGLSGCMRQSHCFAALYAGQQDLWGIHGCCCCEALHVLCLHSGACLLDAACSSLTCHS